jgi:hypothetical protein
LVACRIAPRHADLRVFAEYTTPLPDGPLSVSSVSELCLETCVNVFGRDAPFAEKPNDDSLARLDPLNEKL